MYNFSYNPLIIQESPGGTKGNGRYNIFDAISVLCKYGKGELNIALCIPVVSLWMDTCGLECGTSILPLNFTLYLFKSNTAEFVSMYRRAKIQYI